MSEEKKNIEVACAVIINEGRILATQRGYGNYEGKWEFPGGKIEEGETPEIALIREIREELGCEIEYGHILTGVSYDYPEYHVFMLAFLCQLQDVSKITLKEHKDMKWLDAESIYSVDWLPSDLEVLEMVKNLI